MLFKTHPRSDAANAPTIYMAALGYYYHRSGEMHFHRPQRFYLIQAGQLIHSQLYFFCLESLITDKSIWYAHYSMWYSTWP